MGKVRHWTIQALMGFILIVFAVLSWMGTTSLPLNNPPDQATFRDAPSPLPTYAPLEPVTEPSAAPAVAASFSFLNAPVPEGYLQALEVKVPYLPGTKDEFLALRDSMGVSPEGSAALFVLALNIFVKDQAFGESCLTMMLAHDPTMVEEAAPGAWRGYSPSERSRYFLRLISENPRIARSYLSNSSFKDDYSLPSLPWSLLISRNKFAAKDNGAITVFIYSSGADSRRPIDLIKNDQGIWKVSHFSSLALNVKKPIPPDPL